MATRSVYAFPWGGFAVGMARAFDLSRFVRTRRIDLHENDPDAVAIALDWFAVGEDIADVMTGTIRAEPT